MSQSWNEDDFFVTRFESWESNANYWAKFVDECTLRGAIFNSIISFIRATSNRDNYPPSILDLGCGEGAFLRSFYYEFPSAKLVGLDLCNNMIESATARSYSIPISFVRGNFEAPNIVIHEKFDVVTALLSFIEASELAIPFHNLASSLKPMGTGIVAILDPMNEIYRYFQERREDKKLLTSNNNFLISAHFNSSNGYSPKPYFRFVRPLDEYLHAAFECGLQLDYAIPVIDISMKHIGKLAPRVVVLYFSLVDHSPSHIYRHQN